VTRFRVETEQVDSTVVSLAAMAALCEKLLAEVDSLAASVSTQWSGEANAQFLALKTEWAQGARLMSEGIQVIHQAASVSNATYQAVADAARRVW
jgi:uncharacterized protein YukE